MFTWGIQDPFDVCLTTGESAACLNQRFRYVATRSRAPGGVRAHSGLSAAFPCWAARRHRCSNVIPLGQCDSPPLAPICHWACFRVITPTSRCSVIQEALGCPEGPDKRLHVLARPRRRSIGALLSRRHITGIVHPVRPEFRAIRVAGGDEPFQDVSRHHDLELNADRLGHPDEPCSGRTPPRSQVLVPGAESAAPSQISVRGLTTCGSAAGDRARPSGLM